jgi:hypothetical protein
MKLNLRALIRLAVNNANEAEAGRAAIKVCKALLEQDKTILNAENDEKGATPSAPTQKKEANIKMHQDVRNRDFYIIVSDLDYVQNPRIARLLEELDRETRRPRTWNDVRRSEEPFWRSTPPPYEPYYTGFDWGENPFKERKRHKTQTEPPPQQPTPEDYATGKAKPYDPTNPSNYSKSKPPRDLKCIKCGGTFSTQFVGPPQVFECADCAYGEEFEKNTGRKP